MELERASGISETDDPWSHPGDFDWYVKRTDGSLMDLDKISEALGNSPENSLPLDIIAVGKAFDLELDDGDYVYFVKSKLPSTESLAADHTDFQAISNEKGFTIEDEEKRNELNDKIIHLADEINGLMAEASYYDSDAYDQMVRNRRGEHKDTTKMRDDAKLKAEELMSLITAANRSDLLELDSVSLAFKRTKY